MKGDGADLDSAETAVLTAHAELEALAGEWEELHRASPTATPFQAHAWVAAWARAYVAPGRLRVAIVRRNGRLVAAAPLQRSRRGPWLVLAPLGGAISDHTDVLLAGDEPGAAGRLVDALLDEPDWHVLDLPEVRPGSAVTGLAAHWPGRVRRLAASTCLELPARPLPDLLARLPGRTANTMRRKLRKVDQAGIDVRHVTADEVPAAVDRLLRLHREQWAGRGGNPEHGTDRFRAHLVDALTSMVGDGSAVLAEYCAGKDVRLSQVILLGGDTLSYYLAGIAPQLRKDVDTAALLVRHDVELAVERGLTRYSMLRGLEDYKFRWRPERVEQERLLLSRPGVRGAAGYPGLIRARAGVVAFAKRRAPWVREVRDRVRRSRASSSPANGN